MLIRDFNRLQKNSKRNKNAIDYRSAIMTERFLSLMLKVVSYTGLTKMMTYQNLLRFIEATPLNNYVKDQTIYALILAITTIIKNKLDGATELEDLINYVNIELGDDFGDIKDSIIFPNILSSTEVTDKEINLITKACNTYVIYDAILSKKDELSDIITDIGSGNVVSLEDAIDQLRDVIDLLHDEFSRIEKGGTEGTAFHTSNKYEFLEHFRNTWEYENSQKMVLHTGLKEFDLMLSPRGGFLGGKSYLFMADTNTFKSALLEHIKHWIRKYNPGMFREEYLRTNKRPSILSISIENGIKEDTSRDFAIATGMDLGRFSNPDEAFDKMLHSYDDLIDIYQINPGREPVNLEFIENKLKEMEIQGYFCISIIIDSFDLMSPSKQEIALRISDETALLLNRAREIEKWITDKPFPFITAHQLNRQAAGKISEKKEQGCVDLCKFLDRTHVSGSYDILRRFHWTSFIYTEYSKYDNEKYLEIMRDKVRGAKTEDDLYGYLVVQLEDGFHIKEDQGTDFTSTRRSIIPVDDEYLKSQNEANLIQGQRGILSLKKKEDNRTRSLNPKSNNVLNNSSFIINPVIKNTKKELSKEPIKPMFVSNTNYVISTIKQYYINTNFIPLMPWFIIQNNQGYEIINGSKNLGNYIMAKDNWQTPFDNKK